MVSCLWSEVEVIYTRPWKGLERRGRQRGTAEEKADAAAWGTKGQPGKADGKGKLSKSVGKTSRVTQPEQTLKDT